jgi:prophage antirepressor-like protein
MESRIALFQKKEIRKTLHADEWWFVIVDVVAALTDSANPAEYLKKMRLRDAPFAEALKGGQIVPPLALEFPTAGGPQKLTCWHTEGIFRLIQSNPSPKAEPFKRWLAKVGYESSRREVGRHGGRQRAPRTREEIRPKDRHPRKLPRSVGVCPTSFPRRRDLSIRGQA